MHLTRYTMYRRIAAAIGHQLGGKVLGISGIDNFEPWINRTNSQVVNVSHPEVDMQRLPFGDDEFDVVISDQVIAYVPNPRTAIHEAFRVLKDGGLGIHTTCLWSPILNHPQDYYRFTPDALRVLCPSNTEILECGGWGNRTAMILMLIRDPFFRFLQIPNRPGVRHWLATHNNERYPIQTWVVARKRAVLK